MREFIMPLQRLRCFLSLSHNSSSRKIREMIEQSIKKTGFEVVSFQEGLIFPGNSFQELIIGELAQADCIIADVSDNNPNVFYELGLAQAMGKGILIIAEDRSLKEFPFDIREFRVITYSDNLKALSNLTQVVRRFLNEYRNFPRHTNPLPDSRFLPPFFIDWDKLSKSEIENLCQELLAQMGFRRLDWGKGTRDFDLIAELQKKDPDGFEYNELWIISLGLRAHPEMLIDMVSYDSEYFLHRLRKYYGDYEKRFSLKYETPVTFLLVFFGKSSEFEELELIRERLEKQRLFKDPFGSNVRLRIWGQNYLTSLVHRFPQIGYKYFSDEGRIRSKTRKSYEELYQENSKFTTRLANLVTELEEEKNKRIRAERDSVWKDISFSAAHKIGNPIFAIETDLDPLVKRIKENRQNESIEVVENIRSAVEKAKAFVEQFKSLAKAQEIHPVPILLRPIFEDACKIACNNGIECNIDCPPDLKISGDPDRLAECFDELIMNAMHWFDKPDKLINIVTICPAPKPLADFLDQTQEYVVIHVTDNGCGIPTVEKNRIFDAFYTKYEHGTGLGLALVRRIIEGHGGVIIESGYPGKGANFEVYLPINSESPNKNFFNEEKKECLEF